MDNRNGRIRMMLEMPSGVVIEHAIDIDWHDWADRFQIGDMPTADSARYLMWRQLAIARAKHVEMLAKALASTIFETLNDLNGAAGEHRRDLVQQALKRGGPIYG